MAKRDDNLTLFQEPLHVTDNGKPFTMYTASQQPLHVTGSGSSSYKNPCHELDPSVVTVTDGATSLMVSTKISTRSQQPLQRCSACDREVAYADSVSFRTGSTMFVMCAVCAASEAAKTLDFCHPDPSIGDCLWPLSGPCAACGRMVYRHYSVASYIAMGRKRAADGDPWWKNYGPTAGGLTCSSACNRRAILNMAKAKRQSAREERTCPVCGTVFMPPRDDAVTCSNRCRQALFRQRQRAQNANRN
jgi:predicted nucleic acid-binding Zn ribbon protein